MTKCKQCGVELSIVKGNRKQVILLDKEGYQHKDVCRLHNKWRRLSHLFSLRIEELERKDSRSEAE